MYPIDFFWRAAAHHPDRTAVSSPDETLSFRELAARVNRLGAALIALDPQALSRVAIGASNSVGHLVALLATIAAGKTWVPLNPRNGTPELERAISFTEPTIVVLDRKMHERLPKLPTHLLLVDGSGPNSIDGAIAHQNPCLPALNLPLESTQAIKFTGGTTGMPKGVMQSMRAWNTTIVTQCLEFGFHQEDRFLISAPLTHGASTYVLAVLGAGGRLVFPYDTTSRSLLDTIQNQGITTLFMPPTAIYSLNDEQIRCARNATTLRLLIYGAAAMPPSKIHETQSIFGNIVATTYGQTEAPTVIACLRPELLADERNINSVGWPSAMTKVGIMNKEGKLLPPGTEGEIVVRGDLVMTGYWRMPEQTAATIVDGWLHTGDIGMLDDRGALFIKSRAREVIISGGFNVYPQDVEDALGRHEDVYDSAVVGIEDPKWGEAVHAAVHLRPDANVSAEEIIQFVKAEIGSVKAPKMIHFVSSLPKSPVGKTLKSEVSDWIRQTLNATHLG